MPAFRGALGDDGANRSVRTLLASAATELWTACDEPMDTFPPPPGELNNYAAGTSSTGNQSRASPNLGMMNANGPGHSPLVTGEVYREKARANEEARARAAAKVAALKAEGETTVKRRSDVDTEAAEAVADVAAAVQEGVLSCTRQQAVDGCSQSGCEGVCEGSERGRIT